MKAVLLCSYPPRYITNQKFRGARDTHVSSWNVNLVEGLSRIQDLDLTVITNAPILRSQLIRKGRTTFILYGGIPKVERYSSYVRLWHTRLILNKIQPDIVHGIGNEHMYPWIALHSGFPHIVTYHGILFERWLKPDLAQRIRLRLEREVFKRVKNVIIISPSVEKSVYSGRPIDSPRRFLIPNAIAREFFDFKVEQRDVDLAMVGMIYPVKNTHLLIPVVERLRSKGINVTAKVIGGPVYSFRSYAEDLNREIEAKGLTNVIRICGQIENKVMPTELGRCRILLHLADFETSPMAIREAMALGLVPLAKPVGGIPDMIDHGVNGLLLSSEDPLDDACRLITQLLANPSELQRLSEAARKSVRGICDPDLVASMHYEAYKQVLEC